MYPDTCISAQLSIGRCLSLSARCYLHVRCDDLLASLCLYAYAYQSKRVRHALRLISSGSSRLSNALMGTKNWGPWRLPLCTVTEEIEILQYFFRNHTSTEAAGPAHLPLSSCSSTCRTAAVRPSLAHTHAPLRHPRSGWLLWGSAGREGGGTAGVRWYGLLLWMWQRRSSETRIEA